MTGITCTKDRVMKIHGISRVLGPLCELSRRVNEAMMTKWGEIVKGLAFTLEATGEYNIFKQKI